MNHLTDELINEFLDGFLDESSSKRVEAHLTQCSDCRANYEELASVFLSLDGLVNVPLDRDLVPGVLAQIPETQRAKHLWRQPVFLLQLLMTLILLGAVGGPVWRTTDQYFDQYWDQIAYPVIRIPSLSLPQLTFALPELPDLLATQPSFSLLPGNLEVGTLVTLLLLVGILWSIGNFTLLRNRPVR